MNNCVKNKLLKLFLSLHKHGKLKLKKQFKKNKFHILFLLVTIKVVKKTHEGPSHPLSSSCCSHCYEKQMGGRGIVAPLFLLLQPLL